MARLRREEEARKYESMLTSSSGGSSSNPFSIPSKGTAHDAFRDPSDDDEITFADVNRQLTLIINVLISIIACGVAIWLVAKHFSAPQRLALAMGGALVVAVAEVVIYAGYLRRIQEAKSVEKAKEEKKTVVGTWTIGGSLVEKEAGKASGKEHESSAVRFRAGKRR
jgi:energy-converting hydrogenase Eha subunit C